MRRTTVGLCCAVILAGAAWAADELPREAVGHNRPLLGELRVRYLLRQLDLTEEQAKAAEQIIRAAYTPANERAAGKVRALWRAWAQADAAGDDAKAQLAIKELRKLNEDPLPETTILKQLEEVLTDRQKRKLEAAQRRLKRYPGGGVSPGDMYRIARELDLSAEQNKQLLEIYKATREKLGPILRPSEKKKAELVNYMYGRLLEMLTPEQREVFAYRVRMLRPDLIDEGLRVLPVPEAYRKFCQQRDRQRSQQQNHTPQP